MTTPVSFELAKLLKEKGINIPSNRGLGVAIYEDGKITSTCLYDGTVIHAPTIAEVVMWLYEKYGIWISVIDVSPSHILWEYQISRKEVGLIYSSGQYPVKHNYSPTEAYEAAIKYCLEKNYLI